MAWFARLPYWVWKIFDSLILASLPWLLCRAARLEGRPWAAMTACGVLAFYPWHHISGAGWMVTTVFYLWTGAAALAAMGPADTQYPRQAGAALAKPPWRWQGWHLPAIWNRWPCSAPSAWFRSVSGVWRIAAR